MEALPADVQQKLLLYLPASDILQLRASCRHGSELASGTVLWRRLFLRDLDVTSRDSFALVVNPMSAYRHAIKRHGESRATRNSERERRAARLAQEQELTIRGAQANALSICSWLIAPAPCLFLSLLFIGLRADNTLSWPWPVVFVPCCVLAVLLSLDVGLEVAVWAAHHDKWRISCRCRRQGVDAAQPVPPPSPARPGLAGVHPKLEGSPVMGCLNHAAGPGTPGVALAVALFLLAVPTAIAAITAQSGWVSSPSAPSWAVAFLPWYLFLALLPLGCCAWGTVRNNGGALTCFLATQVCLGLPILACLIPLALALDERTGPGHGDKVPGYGNTTSNPDPGRLYSNAGFTALAGNSSDTGGNVTAAGSLDDSPGYSVPMPLALVPVWVMVSILGISAVGMSIMACVRAGRARLEDLREECWTINLLSLLGLLALALPVSSLALVSVKAEGRLPGLSWTNAVTPILLFLALVSMATTAAGCVECNVVVVRPWRQAVKRPRDAQDGFGPGLPHAVSGADMV